MVGWLVRRQVDCKEFLRVMQLNSAHLCGGVTGNYTRNPPC